MFGTCAISDTANPAGTGPSSLPAPLHINASECSRPAWQHCCHRVVTRQILINVHSVCVSSVLCLMHAPPPPPHPTPPPPLSLRAWLHPSPPTNTTSPLLLLLPPVVHPHPPTPSSPSLTPLYASLHGLWPLPPTPRLAPPPHTTPPGPLGHSGRGGVQGLPDQPGLRYRQRCTGT